MRARASRRRGEGYTEYVVITAFLLICSIVGLLTAGSKALKKINLEKGICANCPKDPAPTPAPNPVPDPTAPPPSPTPTPPLVTPPFPGPISNVGGFDQAAWEWYLNEFLNWF